MNEIRNVDFSVAMKLAADKYLDSEEESLNDTDRFEPFERISGRIKRAIRKDRAEPFMSGFSKAVRVGLIALMSVVTVCSGVALSAAPVRAAIAETFIDIKKDMKDDHIELSFDRYSADKDGTFEMKNPLYVPDGYKIHDIAGSHISIYVKYQNKEGYSIRYSQDKADYAVTAIDNTDVTERTVELEDGTRAELFEYADGYAFMMWADSKYRYEISADSISGDEIIRIADSIK